MSSVRAERLAYSHPGSPPVFSGVTATFPAGFTGVVGANGAGKSTFLRLLAGDLPPDEGCVRVEPEGALVVRCPQEIGPAGRDVLALADGASGAARRALTALRLDPGSLDCWDALSQGERRRWQVGAALAREPEVLLLDEPSNHLDAVARSWLVEALHRFRGVGLVVSHDRGLLEALTSRTLRLGGGTARLHAGPYGAARERWEAEERVAWAARGAAQEAAREAARALDAARREHASAAATRSTGRRAKGRHDHDARTLGAKTVVAWAEARAGRKVGPLRREAERARGAVPEVPAAVELGRSLFVGYERSPRPWLLSLDGDVEAGGATILRDVRVRLGREDRVHLRGANGAGKTTLAQSLLEGARLPAERVLHLPQELEDGAGAAALEDVRALPPEPRGRVLSLVAGLGVDPARLLASQAPSPGEARKLALALGIGRHAWLLVLDEPTNHLDLPSIERLEAALAAYPGALLLVTHDDAFAARCTTSAWRVAGGRVEA